MMGSCSGIQGHNGAEIHGVHVIQRPRKDLLNDDSVRPFRRMERIPERVYVSVRAQVRQRRAQSQSIVRSLSATGHLRRHKTEILRIVDEIVVSELSVCSNEHIITEL